MESSWDGQSKALSFGKRNTLYAAWRSACTTTSTEGTQLCVDNLKSIFNVHYDGTTDKQQGGGDDDGDVAVTPTLLALQSLSTWFMAREELGTGAGASLPSSAAFAVLSLVEQSPMKVTVNNAAKFQDRAHPASFVKTCTTNVLARKENIEAEPVPVRNGFLQHAMDHAPFGLGFSSEMHDDWEGE